MALGKFMILGVGMAALLATAVSVADVHEQGGGTSIDGDDEMVASDGNPVKVAIVSSDQSLFDMPKDGLATLKALTGASDARGRRTQPSHSLLRADTRPALPCNLQTSRSSLSR